MAGKSSASARTSRNRVRIIAGRWRGRWVEFDPHPQLRPSSDRLRETLFNWLQSFPPPKHCLDLFAGSGALGFEAASRGAVQVTLVDSNAAVCQRLREHVGLFKADNIAVAQQDASEFLRQCQSHDMGSAMHFDLVFIDPPFAAELQLDYLQQVIESQTLAANALIFLEADKGSNIVSELPAQTEQLRELRMGNVTGVLLRYNP